MYDDLGVVSTSGNAATSGCWQETAAGKPASAQVFRMMKGGRRYTSVMLATAAPDRP